MGGLFLKLRKAASSLRGMSQQWAGLASRLELVLGACCALLIVSLVAVTCIDVVGRYVFEAPLVGAFEMTQMLLGALVFCALPLTTERREHVEVDLLRTLLGTSVNRFLNCFASLFSMALLLTFGWQLIIHGLGEIEKGTVTNDLSIPLGPLGIFAGLACVLSAGIALMIGVNDQHAAVAVSKHETSGRSQ